MTIGWWKKLWQRQRGGLAANISRFHDLKPGDLVVVELNRELIRGIQLTTENGVAAKLPDELKFIKGFVKRVNQIKPHGNSNSHINVLELLTAVRFDQRSDSATRFELSLLEHEIKSVIPISI